MKITSICLFILLLSFAAFSQRVTTDSDQKFEFKGRFDFENPAEVIRLYRFLDNGRNLLLIGDRSFQLWDVEERKVLKTYPNRIKEFQKGGPWVLSPDGKKLLAFNNFTVTGKDERDDFVSLWSVETGEQITVFDKKKYPDRMGVWSKNGKTLITTDNPSFFLSDILFEDKRTNVSEGIPFMMDLGDMRVSFWDGETFEHRADILLNNVSWYYLTPGGERLFTTQGEKRKQLGMPYSSQKAEFIDVWNTKTGELEKQIPIGDDVFFVRTRKMQMSPGGEYLALIQKSRQRDSDDRLLIWKIDEIDVNPKFIVRANPAISDSDLIYSPDGKYVAMKAGSRVQIYELATGKMVYELKKTEMPNLWLADGKVAVDIEEKKITAYNIISDKEIYRKKLVYEDAEITDYSSIPDANGNLQSETVIVNYTRFAVRNDGNLFLLYDNGFLDVIDSVSGTSLASLITPAYNLKKKKYEDEKLIKKAAWSGGNDNLIYAINSEYTAISIWKYLD